MSTSDFQLTEDKHLFTFQDETKLWISKEFIEKYQQLPFYDIIEHSEKYEDGSYYIDMSSSSMKTVIHFLMEENVDISSLNLRDSYDIYKTLYEYSVTIHNEINSDLLFHIKELFYKYLENNNFTASEMYDSRYESCMPMKLFSLDTRLNIKGLITPKRKEELLYYSLLFKMMNVTKVEIRYDYALDIPLEYICPSCIKDIFPSLKELKITVTTNYKESELLLNPNSDEYIKKYSRLFEDYDYEINKQKKYEYYTESDMNEYNKISTMDLNELYYSEDFINTYNEKRQYNELRKLYKNIVSEAIYTNDYSNVEISTTEDKYTLYDIVSIEYDDKTNDKIFSINKVYTKHGISQLLCFRSYLSISKVIFNIVDYLHNDAIIIMKLFEEGVFDSLTTLSVKCIKTLSNKVYDNLFNKIMTTHVFPNVTELIYDDDDGSYQLSLLKKKCFPQLHIINYAIEINLDDFSSLFPINIMSLIDTIRIHKIHYYLQQKIVSLLDNIVYTHSIHIDKIDDCIYYFPHLKELLEKNLISFDTLYINTTYFENIKKLNYIENYNQNINSLNIIFKDNYYDAFHVRNSLEIFLKSSILEHLNKLTVTFVENISIEYLTWISTLFNDNKLNSIHELKINLHIKEDSSSEYLTAYENIMEKLIPKASIVNIDYCTMTFINRLIPKGCFHNTTELNLDIKDIPDDNFCKLYTTDNFPQLKYIKIYKDDDEFWISFIKAICRYMNNSNFPSSSIVQLGKFFEYYDKYLLYDPNNSILRCKYNSNSFMNTIIGTKDETISKYEIETLFDCINENKTQKLKYLRICIYDEEHLSKLINFITSGKIPELREFYFKINRRIYKQINNYKKQLENSLFVQENHVCFKFDKILETYKQPLKFFHGF
ncbi:hypothetical protein WA158_000218 [Blastocystis sp. Blastoise]